MVSSSSLCKNKEVLTEMVGEKWNHRRCRRQYVALEHGTCLHSCRVGEISSHCFSLPPWVWVIPFDLSSAHCLVTMTFDPLTSNTAKSAVVPSICSREVGLCKYQPSSVSHMILIHNKNIMFLCLVSMMWESLWPTFDQGHFLSTSTHYPGSWSRDSLWYLGACMPQWQVRRI